MSNLASFMRFLHTFSSDPKLNRHFGRQLLKELESGVEESTTLFCEADDAHGLFFFRLRLAQRLGTQTGWVSGLALSLAVQTDFLFIRWVDDFGIHRLWIPYDLLEELSEFKPRDESLRSFFLHMVERKTTVTQGECDAPQLLETNQSRLTRATGS